MVHPHPTNTAIRVGFNVFPAIKHLGQDIGLTGFFLVLKRVKLHIQAVFCRFTCIDCTVNFGHIVSSSVQKN